MATATKKTTPAATTAKKKATAAKPAPASAPVQETTPAEPTKATPEKKEAAKVPGVRPMRTRPYLAGQIIAKHGLAAGVTDAMVAELDEEYGKPNPTESMFVLKNAHHAARGYMGLAEDAAS